MTPDDIKALRKALNLTQQGLADRLGVHLRSVQGWESGEHTPHPIIVGLIRKLERKVKT